MQTEKVIYGLIAAAEDAQKQAIALQAAAADALQKLPEGARRAVDAAARDILPTEAQKAAEALLGASKDVRSAADYAAQKLRHSWVMPVAGVIVAGIVVACVLMGFFFWQSAALSERAALERLTGQHSRVQLSKCGGRPCIRVDMSTGAYGDTANGEEYRIIHGY